MYFSTKVACQPALGRRGWAGWKQFAAADQGAIAVLFALLLVPVLIGVGISVDYLRAYGAYVEMQAELDVALVAAIKKIDNLDTDEIETLINEWFAAQTRLENYSLDEIAVDATGSTITATVNGVVRTTLLQLAGIRTVPISVTSQIAGPATSYLNVYLVLDKSASMMLAATTAGQAAMRSAIGCEFACHTGDSHTIGSKTYHNNYEYSTEAGIKLRSDVLLDAVEEVLATVDELDSSHTRIKVGLYRLSTTTAQVLAPTFSTSAVTAALYKPSNKLTSDSSSDGTYFNTALKVLKNFVGSSGTGKTPGSPLKLVMLITDGVQSARGWVTAASWACKASTYYNGNSICLSYPMSTISKRVTPLNPGWCDPIKNAGATLATVYTTYLPITLDWGYNGTVGNTMSSSNWISTWGGKLHPGVSSSTSRQDYLPIALSDCATSSDYFMQATEANEITSSLSTLFSRYLSTVRLTK